MKTIKIQGKDYVQVNERVLEFHRLYPKGTISANILSHKEGMIVIKAFATPDSENPARIFTGLAYEKEGNGRVNDTSYIENCETSAVGRALGFLGIGIDTEIASADEIAKVNQTQLSKITELIDAIIEKGLKFDEPAFLTMAKSDSLENIAQQHYAQLIKVLEKKLG